MNKQKVFISVSHSLKEPWLSIFQNGSEATWIKSDLPPDFDLAHFHGLRLSQFWTRWDSLHERIRWKNRWAAAPLRWFDSLLGFPFLNYVPPVANSSELITKNLSLQVKCLDVYQFLRWKDLAVLNYFVHQSDAEFLFMTTNNSYVNFRKLKSVVETLPQHSFYGGVKAYHGATFAAGNNRILSRDVAIAILKNRRLFSSGYIEDVAMGALAEKLGFKFQELPSLVVSSLSHLVQVPDSVLRGNFHFRVKSGSLSLRNDVEIMLELHKRLLALGAL